jgi:hypothetical protein
MEDLRSARTWSIVMAICWLGAAALRFVEGGGTQPGLSAWLSIATPLLFISSAVYYQNRLGRVRDEANQAPKGRD